MPVSDCNISHKY